MTETSIDVFEIETVLSLISSLKILYYICVISPQVFDYIGVNIESKFNCKSC